MPGGTKTQTPIDEVPPSSSFSSLPKELHSRILHFADEPTLRAVRTLSSYLHKLAETQLWRHLDIGEDVRVVRDSQENQLLIGGLEGMTGRAGVRWSAVRSVKAVGLALRKGAEDLMIVLGVVGDRLQSLALEAFGVPMGCGCCRPVPWAVKTVDLLLSESDLTFPSLTHITIRPESFSRYDFIKLIVTRAPNLVHLDIDVTGRLPKSASDKRKMLPPLAVPTLLRTLRMTSDDPEVSGIMAVAELISASPELRLVIVDFWSYAHESLGDDEAWQEELAVALQGHRGLRDLYWPVDTILYHPLIEDDASAFESLVRLVVRCDWVDTFEWQYHLPNLQELYVDYSTPAGARHTEVASGHPFSFPPQLLLHFGDFADTLRNYPRLRIIHSILSGYCEDDFAIFEDLDAFAASPLGRVGSMRHDGGEVICVRLLVDFEEVADHEWVNQEIIEEIYGSDDEECDGESRHNSDGDTALSTSVSDNDVDNSPSHDEYIAEEDYITSGTTTSIRYTARDGSLRERVYDRQAEPTWRVLCDYEGLPVPLEVIQAMRGAEGLAAEAWERRDVLVGQAAWSILKEWYEGCLADEAADRETAIVEVTELSEGLLGSLTTTGNVRAVESGARERTQEGGDGGIPEGSEAASVIGV